MEIENIIIEDLKTYSPADTIVLLKNFTPDFLRKLGKSIVSYKMSSEMPQRESMEIVQLSFSDSFIELASRAHIQLPQVVKIPASIRTVLDLEAKHTLQELREELNEADKELYITVESAVYESMDVNLGGLVVVIEQLIAGLDVFAGPGINTIVGILQKIRDLAVNNPAMVSQIIQRNKELWVKSLLRSGSTYIFVLFRIEEKGRRFKLLRGPSEKMHYSNMLYRFNM